MKITAHTLCRNEERYLWYAVSSVIEHVDEHLLWDTSSTDKTREIIQELQKRYPEKIKVKLIDEYDVSHFTSLRQQMIDASNGDWIFIVDADEVWWDKSISDITNTIRLKGKGLETVVNRYFNLVGDIYHYLSEEAGKYKIDQVVGHITVRAMNRNIPGFKVDRPHGVQAFYDADDVPVQNREKSKRFFYDTYSYLHFTHLLRSSDIENDRQVAKRDFKYKYELGIPFARDFYYPEVFFKPKPDFVYSPWEKRSNSYVLRAGIQTPLKKIRRKLKIRQKDGY